MDNVIKIVKGCKSRDKKSREQLYQLYSGKMYGICIRYTKNPEDANDVLHEGFLKVFQNIGQLKEPKAVEGWMRKIMVNTALEKFRKKIDTDPIHEVYLNTKEEQFNVIDEITNKDLLKLINGLSPQYQLVFNLYAIEGYSHKEISEKLNISEGTSKSNLSRARAILQEKVKKLYDSSNMIIKK